MIECLYIKIETLLIDEVCSMYNYQLRGVEERLHERTNNLSVNHKAIDGWVRRIAILEPAELVKLSLRPTYVLIV